MCNYACCIFHPCSLVPRFPLPRFLRPHHSIWRTNTECRGQWKLMIGLHWVPASAAKAKAGLVHFVSGWTRGLQVQLWDPLRTCAISERLRGMFTTRCYINPRLPYRTLPTLRDCLLTQEVKIWKTRNCHERCHVTSNSWTPLKNMWP